jgi:hypothetical protein
VGSGLWAYAAPVRKGLLVFGLLLVVAGVAVVSLPFGRPLSAGLAKGAPVGELQLDASRCSAPVLSSFRHEPSQAGWFGYAPLTSTPVTDVSVPCKPHARRRLAGGGLFVLCGVAVGVVAWRRPRGAEPVVDDPA